MSIINVDQKTKQDLEIYKACDFQLSCQMTDYLTGTPLDITGYTITSVIREERRSSAPILATFDITKTQPTMGWFMLSLSDTQTTVSTDYGYYTVLFEDGTNFKDVLFHGDITFFETT